MEIKIYANYGVLAAEKRTVYTFGGHHPTAVTWDKMTVEIPSGWKYWENAAGAGIVTAPWGWDYAISEVLCGDDYPLFYAMNDNMEPQEIRLKVRK